MLTGIFSTLLLPETMGRSLEELSNEDQDGFVKGSRGKQLIFYSQNVSLTDSEIQDLQTTLLGLRLLNDFSVYTFVIPTY